MTARDELAPMQELDAHRPTHREYTGGWWELACTGCDFAEGRRLSHLDWAPHHAHREEIFRNAILAAGYVLADHTEYALDHKRADIQFTDDDGNLWDDEDDVKDYASEYGDTAPLVKRHVTAWEAAQ